MKSTYFPTESMFQCFKYIVKGCSVFTLLTWHEFPLRSRVTCCVSNVAALMSWVCFLLIFSYKLTLFYFTLAFYLNKLLKFHKAYIISVFTKSVDSNFRSIWSAPVTWNILGYSLFCERREKWRVVSRKFQKKKLWPLMKRRFFIHLIW